MNNNKIEIPKRLRQTFNNMKQRCYNPKAKGYKYYGEKGVTICKDWLNDSNKFYEWALNNGYQDDLSIDRIETDGNYEPNNCRWITMFEQQSNKNNTIFIEIDGERKTIAQLSRESGIEYGILKRRIDNGEKDIFREIETSSLNIKINGETKSLYEWSKITGIPYLTLYDRYNRGWELSNLISPQIDNTQYIEINGEIHSITEWAKISGLTREIISNRISYGWKNEDLLKPKKREGKKKYIEIDGELHTIDEWCTIADIHKNTFYNRLKKGLKGKSLIKPTSK